MVTSSDRASDCKNATTQVKNNAVTSEVIMLSTPYLVWSETENLNLCGRPKLEYGDYYTLYNAQTKRQLTPDLTII